MPFSQFISKVVWLGALVEYRIWTLRWNNMLFIYKKGTRRYTISTVTPVRKIRKAQHNLSEAKEEKQRSIVHVGNEAL
jgi:hypothetical protein